MNTDLVPAKSLAEQQRDFVRWQIVGKDITADEFEFFMWVAQHLGLDPMRRQIYCIKRGWGDRAKATPQIAIDGYRAIAARTGELGGIDDAEYDSEEQERPLWSKVTVWRIVQGQRCPFSAKARWSEYRQVDSAGKLTTMWLKMPFLMLAKCAESLALRKAFPAELSGYYTDVEMMQADNPPLPAMMPNEQAIIADEQRLPTEHQNYPAVEAAPANGDQLANEQQKQSITKLSIALGREEPSVETYAAMTFDQAGAYIRQLSRDYNARRK